MPLLSETVNTELLESYMEKWESEKDFTHPHAFKIGESSLFSLQVDSTPINHTRVMTVPSINDAHCYIDLYISYHGKHLNHSITLNPLDTTITRNVITTLKESIVICKKCSSLFMQSDEENGQRDCCNTCLSMDLLRTHHKSKKVCLNPDCSIRSSYGAIGSKKAEYCKYHAPSGYVMIY